MYTAYIKNFRRGNSIVTTEEQMFKVPSAEGFPIQKPIVKSSEDSADNFSFTMDCNSPYYDALLQKKTLIRIVYDGPNSTDTDIIFYGRVLNISTSTFLHTKNVTCEGTYSYLNDSYYEGKQEKYRNKITVSEYFSNIIANHNSMIFDKYIAEGTIGVILPSEKDKREPTSWSQSTSLLNDLTSNFGGHMRIRYSGTSPYTAYLDWYKYYSRDLGEGLRPKVTVGKNILDINSDISPDNVFTRVIPIGSTSSSGQTVYIENYVYDGQHAFSGKAMSVPFITNLYSASQLNDDFHKYTDYLNAENDFGVIYKTVSFSDVTTQSKLWNKCKEWIKESYFGLATSFTIKAIDLHTIDNAIPKILLGECVDVTYKIVRNGEAVWETKKLVCKNVSYDLFNPENNSYTFGLPSDLLNYDSSKKRSTKKKTASDSGAKKPSSSREKDDPSITWDSIYRMIGERDGRDYPLYEGTDCARSFKENGELTGTITIYDPNEVIDNEGHTIGIHPELYKDYWITASLVGKISLPNKVPSWIGVTNDGRIFAAAATSYPYNVRHWYTEKSGATYKGSEPALSTFEKIAQMIEKSSDATWGGATNANKFREYGEVNGSFKCYDPAKVGSQQLTEADKFTAQFVGKFGSPGAYKYVLSSDEYGIFGCYGTQYPAQVQYWYMQAKGNTYNNVNGLITEGKTGASYMTDDKTPDGNKSIGFEPETVTGVGSTGEVFFGHDLRTFAAYSSSTVYEVGDKCTRNGITYRCIVKANKESWNASHWEVYDRWKVKLNVPIMYTDSSGTTRTSDGFVSASDFNLDEIPSFKTKLAVVDVLIAGKVSASEIEADIGYIRKLSGNTIVAGTSVRSQYLYGTNNYLTNIYSTGDVQYLYSTSSGQSRVGHIQKCFDAFNISESGGVITLSMSPVDGSASVTDSFNMASTQFFQDEVEAAYERGKHDGGGGDVDIYRDPIPSPYTRPQTRGPDDQLHYCNNIGDVDVSSDTKSIYFIVTVGDDAYYWCIGINHT